MATIEENAAWCGYHTLAERVAYCEGAEWVLEELEEKISSDDLYNVKWVRDFINEFKGE